jgi:hypothetical protein
MYTERQKNRDQSLAAQSLIISGCDLSTAVKKSPTGQPEHFLSTLTRHESCRSLRRGSAKLSMYGCATLHGCRLFWQGCSAAAAPLLRRHALPTVAVLVLAPVLEVPTHSMVLRRVKQPPVRYAGRSHRLCQRSAVLTRRAGTAGCRGCAAGGGRWRCTASTRSSPTGKWRRR